MGLVSFLFHSIQISFHSFRFSRADVQPVNASLQKLAGHVRTHSSMILISIASHSDLANLVNIAAIKAAVEGADKLNASQLEFAKDRIIMGTERKTMFLSEESKKV